MNMHNNLQSQNSVQHHESENDPDFHHPSSLGAWDETDGLPSVASRNCHGVVHVRVICAQKLPCPVGSSVCAAVALNPWQGRVRTHRTPSFLKSYEHGVCVRWDKSENAGLCSMVHAWSSADSPIPSIACDLMFSPLGVGLLDFTMCSFEIPCTVLLKHPGIWKTDWFQSTTSSPKQESRTEAGLKNNLPLIKLEAMFAPSATGPDKSIRMAVCGTGNPEPAEGGGTDNQQKGHIVKSANIPGVVPGKTSTRAPIIDNSNSRQVEKKTALPDSLCDPHLLRVESAWVPKNCCVCSTAIFGRNQCFSCEVCSIQCCSDCRLHVDLQLPCGSEASKMAAADALRKKISVDNILSVVAPDEGFTQQKHSESSASSAKVHSDEPTTQDKFDRAVGIGCLVLEFSAACLFQNPLNAYDDPLVAFSETGQTNARKGDYYARFSMPGNETTARTPTLQNTRFPNFEGAEMRFSVEHYGQEFRFEVVDASTDTVIGATLLTTHGLILDQKEELLSSRGASLLQFYRGPLVWSGKRPIKLLLRREDKSAASSEDILAGISDGKEQSTGGSITGWLEVRISLEEYVDQLYGRKGVACPTRPTPDLNFVRFQTHVLRLKRLLLDLNNGWKAYKYLVSWKDPLVTSVSFIVFTLFCILFDSEYIGCLPVLGPLMLLAYFSWTRDTAGVKNRFVRKEIEALKEDSKLSYSLHRPIGTIEIMVFRGRRLCSRDLGIPGKSACHVIWDPLRYADKTTKQTMSMCDKAAAAEHEVGRTDQHFSTEPVWDEMVESDECTRLRRLLPWEGGFFESSNRDERTLRFPLLQPFELMSYRKDNLGRFVDAQLKPWITSPGAIVLRVRFQDFLNQLPGFAHVLGEVVIPFEKVVEAGELTGWFEVLGVGSTAVSTRLSEHELLQEEEVSSVATRNTEPPFIFATLKWSPPRTERGYVDDESERLASQVLQEELVRAVVLYKHRKTDLLESSLGAVNTALGIGESAQLIQNYLGTLVDFMELMVNAVNFTDPFVSSVLFASLFLLFLLFVVVPTRFIVLSAGIVQFGSTWGAKYAASLQNPRATSSKSVAKDGGNSDLLLWINNGIQSLPTRHDLWKICAWECRRLVAQEREKYASQKRVSRLKRLWKARWYSSIRIRVAGKETGTIGTGSWEPAFGVMEGHRFLWWDNVDAFDNGEEPAGRIYLSGHSGLTGPSPLECRELSAGDVPLAVGIFGRGLHHQERVVMLVPEPGLKRALERLVSGLTMKDD